MSKVVSAHDRSELTVVVLGYFLFLGAVAGVVIGLFNISAKNVEANSAAVSAAQADHTKSKPHKPRVIARQHNNYEGLEGPSAKRHKKMHMSTGKNGVSKVGANGGY